MSGDLLHFVLLANAASTLLLVGLIWFVQVVHYPQFARVGRDCFAAYESAHMRLTTRVVAPLMLVEALTSAILAWQPPSADLAVVCWIGIVLVIAIWVSTATLQVPRHHALARAFDVQAHLGLVRSNWIRTAAWSLRGALTIFILDRLARGQFHG